MHCRLAIIRNSPKSEICNPKSGKPDVLAGVHLKIQHQRILRVRLNDFLHKLHEDRVLAENCVFVHRLKIDGDEEWPLELGVDALAAFDAEHLRNFQELHPRVHHHLFHTGRRDLGIQFVENDMMNHEGKANRRFQGAAQVRIDTEAKRIDNILIAPYLFVPLYA
jgi:hypothetical protein